MEMKPDGAGISIIGKSIDLLFGLVAFYNNLHSSP
jgi:hypothetical protein